MGKVILTTTIERKPGYLYYCSTDPKTKLLTVCEAVMARGGKRKKSKKKLPSI
jgi:hypothetical protein